MSEQTHHPEQEKAFGVYSLLLEQVNLEHPQHQGLREDEFIRATENPSVITTDVRVGSDIVKIPQLAPVESFEWLNAEFYKSHFSDEYANGNVMHFSEIPDAEPSDEVIEGLKELADKSGVLVFDTPSSDPEQINRIVGMLDSLHIRSASPELLGTQTYFAGQLTFKRSHQEREKPLSPQDAFDLLVADGEFDEDEFMNGISLEKIIDGTNADRMYDFFKEAYEQISDHPCAQALSPDEFKEMLSNPEIAKIIARNDGIAETLCLITDDIDELTWINPQYYAKKFPERYKNKQVVWFPAIATDPDPSIAGHNGPRIVGLIAELCEKGDNDFVVVFDTPDINKEFLPAYLDASINATPQVNISFESLGEQCYFAVRLGEQSKAV